MTTERLTAPKAISLGPNRVTYLLSSSQTGGQFSLKRRMLVISTPAGFEQFWSERAQQITTYGAKVDPALVLELQQKYKMDMGGQVRQFSSFLPKEE